MFQTEFVEECLMIFFPENRGDNVGKYRIIEPDRLQMTIWRTRIACWILKATCTHSEYAMFTAFPPQQWLHERTSVLRYTYIASIVRDILRLCPVLSSS